MCGAMCDVAHSAMNDKEQSGNNKLSKEVAAFSHPVTERGS